MGFLMFYSPEPVAVDLILAFRMKGWTRWSDCEGYEGC